MPNIKSAKKRVLVNEKKSDNNKSLKAEVKTAIKKLNTLIESGDKKAATDLLPATMAIIDNAVSKGIYHKNTAANKISGLAKRVNAMA